MTTASAMMEETGNPLHVGLRLAARAGDRRERMDLLLEVLRHFGRRCDVTAARETARLARALQASDPREAARLLGALEGRSEPGAQWLCAELHEAAGCYAKAASVLQAIPDLTWGEERALRMLWCARSLLRTGERAGSWNALREAARRATSYRTVAAIDGIYGRLRRLEAPPSRRHCRIAMVGSSTLDLWVPALRVGLFAAGVDAEIYQGAYGQYQQEILDPGSGLASFRPEYVVIATDWRSFGLAEESHDGDAAVESAVTTLRRLWRRCHDGLGAFVIQHNLAIPVGSPYGRLSTALPTGRGRLLRRINLELWQAEAEEAGLAILDVEQAAAAYGKLDWEDPVLWHAAKQYPAADALPWLVRHQVALLRAALGLNAKCVVLDLDGVLWGGVVGEDGLTGIRLGGSGVGEAHQAFQHYLKSLRRRGIVLAVCSKNNEEDARLPFQEHPEMVLTLDDITPFVANWCPKDENLRRIAETLNLGLDSLVFVDDNPVERAWLRQQLPQVEVPEMPSDPALYVRALDQGLYFEALSLTDDDRQRAETYRANAQRRALEEASTSLEQFLADLRMRVELSPFDEANLPRITQLINKTNQFNLTTRRRSESQLRALMASSGCYTQAVRLSDRFGDSGLTGVLIAVLEGQGLRIDTWLLSCRVLGREVEKVMLGALARHGPSLGATCITGDYIPTEKNAQVRDLFPRLGFEPVENQPDGVERYQLDITRRSCEWPAFVEVHDRTGAPGERPAPCLRSRDDLPLPALSE
jgi:FkbH-like protein